MTKPKRKAPTHAAMMRVLRMKREGEVDERRNILAAVARESRRMRNFQTGSVLVTRRRDIGGRYTDWWSL